ncbi:ATP-binding protein [Gorillibacterium massiliense]|uniref:ATP-binding protein n=1 Tax=Gorillibacterium massiliense TaxID=1280390 RepID=UPI0005937C42|nr:ATP-binding protein [Gorillibacterium massiliense]
MSIKIKLSLLVFALVSIIMALNVSITYVTSRDVVRHDFEHQMEMTARGIATVIENSQLASLSMDQMLTETLRLANVMFAKSSPADIYTVEESDLSSIAQSAGISSLSLAMLTDDGWTIIRSSDSDLLERTLPYSIADMRINTIQMDSEQKDSFKTSSSVFTVNGTALSGKWGFTLTSSGYMICSRYSQLSLLPYRTDAQPDSVIEKTLNDNPLLLEISGYSPQLYNSITLETSHQESSATLLFGTNRYASKSDAANVNKAFSEQVSVTDSLFSDGKHVIKSYFPVSIGKPCVITVVSEYSPIENVLNGLLFNQITISLFLMICVLVASYIAMHVLVRPLNRILKQVSDITAGQLGVQNTLIRKDELGILGQRINLMSFNLQESTGRLRAAVNELSETQDELLSFMNSTTDSIVVMDLEGKVLRVNHAFEALFSWKLDEIKDQELPIVTGEAKKEMSNALAQISRGVSLTGVEVETVTKAGQNIAVSVTLSPLRQSHSDVIGAVAIGRDITERKKTEEYFLRSEKLAIVGQLAAGVAHEIRNPLTTLRGFVQLLKSKGQGSPQYLDLMLSELDRINFIVSEFMVLAKPHINRFHLKDPRELMRETIVLMQPQALLHNVRITELILGEVPPIFCEENQLKQVFINLLKNSIEAMPEGGEIRIRLSMDSQNRVRFRFVDEGCGISQEQLERIGEPFYTNKESGTGLGLMVSQRIIANHKGVMYIKSELNKGTCIDIVLPIGQSHDAAEIIADETLPYPDTL